MRHFLLATRNAYKAREFSEILGPGFAVRDLSAEPDAPVIEESGRSFAENAILKAVTISRQYPGLLLGDDSGLEVDVLDGAPGIYSARYAGRDAKDTDNTAKLLGELAPHRGTGPLTARFCCVLALAQNGALLGTFEGAMEGTIVETPRGNSGFGYDPVFLPAGSARTFAELSAGEKNRISHRARATELLRAALLT